MHTFLKKPWFIPTDNR